MYIITVHILHVVEILLCQWNQGDNLKSIALFQNEGLISVPTECFVAVALLSLQKTFAADASLSRRTELPGDVRWAASLALWISRSYLWRWIPEKSFSLYSNQPLHIVFSSGISHKRIVINWSLNPLFSAKLRFGNISYSKEASAISNFM